MPGLPPNTSHYQVGGVKIILGGLDLGNIAGFGIDPSNIEVLQHFSSRTGARKVDRQVVVQKRLTFRATLDEIQPDLFAKYFMGALKSKDQPSDAVLALTNPLAETNCVITYLNESGNIWTYSHTKVTVRPAAAMDFGDFSDWVGFEIEIESLQDENAPAIGGTVPTHGFFDFAL